jgi:hypothetical protein
MPILTVQHILGHRYVETTLGYARLYDSTIAENYERAMGRVEDMPPFTNQKMPFPQYEKSVCGLGQI